MKPTDSLGDVTAPRKRGRPPRDTISILQAAVTVFAREGYAAATVEMIAAEASASTATLYKRFTNKHGLFIAVLQETTNRAVAMQDLNLASCALPFSKLIDRLEAHAVTCSDAEVRGVTRAWIGEVHNRSEITESFAVNAERVLTTNLIAQLKAFQDSELLDFSHGEPNSGSKYVHFAAQLMLGIVERFTLVRGLVLGDNTQPVFSARAIAEHAVHAMVGIWGTPKGLVAFEQSPKAELEFLLPPRANSTSTP